MPLTMADYLSKLPTELLHAICEQVVVEIEDIRICAEDPDEDRLAPAVPALCQVNRRLRLISLPIYYSKNTFDIMYDDFDRSIGIEFVAFAENLGLRIPNLFDWPTTCIRGDTPEARSNMLAWAKRHYENSPSTKYELRVPTFHPEFPLASGETTHFWFDFVHKIWEEEWARAGENRANMLPWASKLPAMQAALRMVEFGTF